MHLGVGLAVAALALSGCAAGEAGTGEDLTGEPISIGFVASESGPYSDGGGAAAAAAFAWQELVNAEGGIGGRPIKIQFEDSQTTAAGLLAGIDRVVENPDNVAIFISDQASEVQVDQHLQDQGLAVISAGGSNDVVWGTHTNLFQPVTGSPFIVETNLTSAIDAGAKSMGWAYCLEAATCAENVAILTEQGLEAGVANAGNMAISSTSANYTAECLAWIENGAEAIGFSLAAQVAARVMADCIQQGYEGFFTISGALDTHYIDQAPGATAVGAITAFPWWADAAPVERFRNAMIEYSPDVAYSNGQATATWAALELFRKAIGETPTDLTRESVLESMVTIKDETLDGLLAQPVTFTAGQPSELLTCVWGFSYTAGDGDPTSVPPTGESGNGQTGDLASTCV